MPPAFRHLGDLRLREQHEIEGDLRGDAGSGRESGAELGDASPVRVPGKCRDLKVELPCIEVEQRDAAVAEPGERPGRATELRREPLSGHLLESHAGLDDRREPAGSLEAEGRRHGVLQERSGRPSACRGDRCASAAVAAATSSASASTSASARRETSIAAVSTMSWLVAPRCT